MTNLDIERQKLAISNVVTDALNAMPVTIVELIISDLLNQVRIIKQDVLSEEYHKIQDEALNKDNKEDEENVQDSK